MSHYNLAVLVDGVPVAAGEGFPRFEALIARATALIAPYHERLVVPLTSRRCACVGAQAVYLAHGMMERALGPQGEVWAAAMADFPTPQGEALGALIADAPAFARFLDERERRWERALVPRRIMRAWFRSWHPLRDAADPDCNWCGGAGEYESTDNPVGYYDGWRMLPWDDHGREWSKAARELPPEFCPFALVTPDGSWHARGRAVAFGGIEGDEGAEEWRERFAALVARHPDALCVVGDAHV